jgi:AcrR family transcriptional regulator
MPPEERAGRVGRAERAEQLLDVALHLIVHEGYDAASIRAIAQAAGITKPIIYRIYPSRQALLLALFRREQRRTEAALDEIVPAEPGDRHPVELMTASLEGILQAATEHPDTWRLLLFPLEGTPAPLRALVRRSAGARPPTPRAPLRALVRRR